MLFLIPLAVEAVEGVTVLAESTAVRSAVVEGGEYLMSTEAGAAVSSVARTAMTQLASAEGRAAIVDSIGANARSLVTHVASKASGMWGAAEGAAGAQAATVAGESAAGSAAATAAAEGTAAAEASATGGGVSGAAKELAKGYAKYEATSDGWDALKGAASDAAMVAAVAYFAKDMMPSEDELKHFSNSVATFGLTANLAHDLKQVSGEIIKDGATRPEAFGMMQQGLLVTKEAFPEKEATVDALNKKFDTLYNLDIVEAKARTEVAAGGLTKGTLDELHSAVAAASVHADGKASASLQHAQESLSELSKGSHKDATLDALSEVSVAKNRLSHELSTGVAQLAGEVDKAAGHAKTDLANSTEPLMPSIIHQSVKEAEASHDAQRVNRADHAQEAHQAQATPVMSMG